MVRFVFIKSFKVCIYYLHFDEPIVKEECPEMKTVK